MDQTPSQIPPPMMNAQAFWERLGVSRPTFFRLKREGKIPQGIRVGDRAIRWERATVEEFIRSRAAATK